MMRAMTRSGASSGSRDLLVTVHTPVRRSGRGVRTYGVARALAAAGDGLTVLYVRFGAPEPDAAFAAIPGIELRPVEPSRGAARALAYARARLRGVPEAFARGISPELTSAAAQLAAGHRRTVADGPIAAAALGGLPADRPLVYNAHNLESAFRHELEGSGLGSRRSLRAFERRLLERADVSWMASEADTAAARELCPAAEVRYVPNVVDVAQIEPVRPATDRIAALFVADYTYEPNRNALRFLCEEVMPRVWERLDGARLLLAGPGLDGSPSADPRVERLGFVPDLRDAYAAAACAVVPLLQGGGSPLKFVEALAYGIPVVATPRAAAGLAVRPGEHYVEGDGADGFADALVRVLRDGADEVGRRGRELAEREYSIESLTSRVAA